jgi:ribosome-associated toxin RatA of RatAB toxin-antitoxin module
MPRVQKSILVPYTPEQMFVLVNDVAQYPVFLPFCTASHVVEATADCIVAGLTLAKGGMSKSFTTRNVLTPFSKMEVTLVDGPFKYLNGHWQFIARDSFCQISLDMDYDFDSKMLAMLFGPLFSSVASSLVDAFAERAHEVYSCK